MDRGKTDPLGWVHMAVFDAELDVVSALEKY